jgi:hypothetical protein
LKENFASGILVHDLPRGKAMMGSDERLIIGCLHVVYQACRSLLEAAGWQVTFSSDGKAERIDLQPAMKRTSRGHTLHFDPPATADGIDLIKPLMAFLDAAGLPVDQVASIIQEIRQSSPSELGPTIVADGCD